MSAVLQAEATLDQNVLKGIIPKGWLDQRKPTVIERLSEVFTGENSIHGDVQILDAQEISPDFFTPGL